jgi:hypothetical protein
MKSNQVVEANFTFSGLMRDGPPRQGRVYVRRMAMDVTQWL